MSCLGSDSVSMNRSKINRPRVVIIKVSTWSLKLYTTKFQTRTRISDVLDVFEYQHSLPTVSLRGHGNHGGFSWCDSNIHFRPEVSPRQTNIWVCMHMHKSRSELPQNTIINFRVRILGSCCSEIRSNLQQFINFLDLKHRFWELQNVFGVC